MASPAPAPAPMHIPLPQGVLADFAPLTPPRVPALVVQCVHEVESRGLAEVQREGQGPVAGAGGAACVLMHGCPQTGLYRVPGAESLVREWRQKLLRGRGPAGRVPDVHVACGVLKDFLRGLREPLVTFRLHPAFLRAAGERGWGSQGQARRPLTDRSLALRVGCWRAGPGGGMQ